MVNLSTVYAISIILASMAGMGSAFVGHKFYPIKGGAAIPPPSPAEVYAEAQKTAELAKKLAQAQIPPASGNPKDLVYNISTVLTKEQIKTYISEPRKGYAIPLMGTKVLIITVLEKSALVSRSTKRVTVSRKMNGTFEFKVGIKEGEESYATLPDKTRMTLLVTDSSKLDPEQLQELQTQPANAPQAQAIPVPIAPQAQAIPVPISPQPDIPVKEEEIPAKAPTDTNNEPSQIPTYLPTPEEPEPTEEKEEEEKEEEEEENPTGGALGLQERIEQEFGMNEEFAANVMLFITTPVEDWAQIASTQDELFQKFKATLTDPQLGTCPATLKDICKIVVVKYTNMEKLINGKEYVPYGDQTEEATRLLSSIA
jgi:hypothetical protein